MRAARLAADPTVETAALQWIAGPAMVRNRTPGEAERTLPQCSWSTTHCGRAPPAASAEATGNQQSAAVVLHSGASGRRPCARLGR